MGKGYVRSVQIPTPIFGLKVKLDIQHEHYLYHSSILVHW